MKTDTRTDVDLRPLQGPRRFGAALLAFDALAEGESLVLADAGDMLDVFTRLRAEREGLFLWSPLSAEDGRFRVEVVRLRPKGDETGILEFFGRDHDEIDALLIYLQRGLNQLLESGEPPVVPLLAQFTEFNRRLERHIRWEEEILFPAVEGREPQLVQGPGRVMRWEHGLIREQKDAIRRGLQANPPEPEKAALALEEMLGVLMIHNRKEEQIYYPLSERIFSADEQKALLASVRAMP